MVKESVVKALMNSAGKKFDHVAKKRQEVNQKFKDLSVVKTSLKSPTISVLPQTRTARSKGDMKEEGKKQTDYRSNVNEVDPKSGAIGGALSSALITFRANEQAIAVGTQHFRRKIDSKLVSAALGGFNAGRKPKIEEKIGSAGFAGGHFFGSVAQILESHAPAPESTRIAVMPDTLFPLPRKSTELPKAAVPSKPVGQSKPPADLMEVTDLTESEATNKGNVMSNVPHELSEEFPELSEKMHTLKISDNHYVKLADAYHTVNREIHRIEVGEEHLSQFEEEHLRKKRMSLKDEVFEYIQNN